MNKSVTQTIRLTPEVKATLVRGRLPGETLTDLLVESALKEIKRRSEKK